MTRPGGGAWTKDQEPGPDLTRPIRTDLTGIPTWAPGISDAAPGAGGASMGTASLIIDLELSQFGGGETPRKGDRLGLPQQAEGERLVEILRKADDGSARLLYTCQIVQERKTTP